jgi:acyl-[acyl-carrier-protein]-phospholipid O-acyltransferase/long-chain-fatty-acid--[acyl-carrier-protein] ligase
MSQFMPLHHAFIVNAKKRPDKTAIIDRSTERRVSYSRALTGSLILARRMRKLPDYHIGIMVPTSAGCFLSVIGALMAGKVPVMINYSTGAENNCAYAQQKCGFKTIITSRALLLKIGCRQLPDMIILEDIIKSAGLPEKLPAFLLSKLPLNSLLRNTNQSKPGDTAVVLFTSGSEKEPKAVELTHNNLSANIRDAIQVFGLTSDDVLMSILPLFHVFGHMVTFWMPMVTGMTAVTYANPLDFKKIPQLIREEKATVIAGTPSFFAGYVREAVPGDVASLRTIVAGADRVPDWLRDQYWKNHGKILLEGYGTTETSPVISSNTMDANKPGSLGKPFPGADVRIADLNTGETLGAGHEGKILVRGDLVMKGYFDDVEETSVRIREGWYDTGDMGVMDTDGFLWHKGRLKRFVKIGGEMVSLVQTEEVMEKVLPAGTEYCVVEIPDRMKGARLVAAITADIDEARVLKELASCLPKISVPSRFIRLDELPKMGSGKVDFRKTTAIVRQKLLF